MSEVAEKRFVRLPAESVRLCAERMGIQTSAEVSNALVEDVSFRIRQITDVASQFMRHAKRRRLTVEDFDKALKWSGIEPLYGHHTPDAPQFTAIPQMMLYSVHDPEVRLEDIALATPVAEYTLPDPPSVKATWLSVEGVAVSDVDSGESSQDHVVVKRTPNETRDKYFSLLLETITGDSEDLRRLALADVQSNSSIANILPDMAQYLQETLARWSQFTPVQLLKIFKLLLSLFRNSSVFLEPYIHCIFPHLKSIVLDSAYLSSGGEFDHWHVRQLAAVSIAQLLQRCGSPLSDYNHDLLSSFGYQFSVLTQQDVAGLPVLFSIVVTLLHLGGQSSVEVLLPHLEAVVGHLQVMMKSRDASVKDGALRVTSCLLDVAVLLLTSNVCVRPDQLRTSSPKSTPPQFISDRPAQPPATDSGSGFLLANTSFGLGSEKSDLDGGESNLAGVGPGGRGGSDTLTDEPTLYGFLFDLFGESLTLRLTGHEALKKTSSPPSQVVEPHISPPAAPTSRDIRHVNQAIVQFLSQEGFKPIRVDLPYHLPQPRHLLYGERRAWTFSIPRFVLPVQGNALEHGVRMGRTQRQHDYRGRIKTGASVSYKRRSHKLRHSSDIGSSWL